jgi:hypothetical protein
LPARGRDVARFAVTPPAGAVVRRERVAADIVIGDRAFGQQAEALITVHSATIGAKRRPRQ